MRTTNTHLTCGLLLAAAVVCPPALAAESGRPFMLWTGEEAAAVRRKVRTEAWAKAAAARDTDGLVRYGILGDKAAGESEKKLLLADLSAFEKAASRSPGEYYRVAGARNACRFDVVHPLLSAQERRRVQRAFREAVQWRADGIAGRRWTRANWLPNLEYVGFLRLHLAAAATGDRDFIRKLWNVPNGLKWYLDEYLSDSGFYNEEFGKSMWMYEPMAQWCRAMDRLGMADIGWDYKGRQGASFRGCIESLIHLTYPRVDLDRPGYHFARLSMGDARGGGGGLSGGAFPLFQHRLVAGDLPPDAARQKGLGGYFAYANALEHLHAKWPQAGYGYFLVQHGGGKAYDMPLSFGLPPIEPTAPPPPAPSGVYPGRGLVMLRAEESPAYWQSAAPAVALRLATAYAHHVQDSLAIAGFYAFNRPLFVNHSHPTGYTGTDPGYSNSVRSHSAVMVDRREPAFLSRPLAVRHAFGSRVKFVAARGKGIFTGVDQTRALMLTRDYLLDVSHLVSDRPRDYLWQIHTFGQACPDNAAAWADSTDLRASLGDLGFERSCATDATWTVTAVQTSGTQNRDFSTFGPRWFTDRIGVRVTVLGEPGTRAYSAWAPVVSSIPGDWRGRNRFAYGEDEPAGVAVVATRRAAATMFVAVHEPFKGIHRLATVRRVAQTDDAVVLAVRTPALPKAHPARDASFTDFLMLRFGDRAGEPITLGDGDEQFTFADHAWVRHTDQGVTVEGDLRALRLPVGDVTACPVTVNASRADAKIEDGCVVVGALRQGRATTGGSLPPTPGPVAARFHPPSALCLPTAGKGTRTLKLRNNGLLQITAEIPIQASRGLAVTPAVVSLKDFAPGAEMDVTVAVDASAALANRLHEVRVGGAVPPSLHVQHAALPVANGVATDGRTQTDGRIQLGDEFHQTVYSPRYVATYWFMESAGATELLDPAGFRRHNAAGSSYPSVATRVADAQGRQRWEVAKAGKYPYFIPLLADAGAGRPRYLYEHGQHVHGFSGGLAHWFTEDWIVVRARKAKGDETISFDWDPRGGYRGGLSEIIPGRDPTTAAEKMPGTAFLIDDKGERHVLAPKSRPGLTGVAAMFVRPDGYEHGWAAFYPRGATWQDGRVAQGGQTAMAFTFCTEEEFPALLAKWQANPHTGQSDPADVARNRGAFGPAVVAPDD